MREFVIFLMLALLVGCRSTNQPKTKEDYAALIVGAVAQSRQARIDYARQWQQYFRDKFPTSRVDVDARSTKGEVIVDDRMLLVMRCEGEADSNGCMREPELFLKQFGGHEKLRDLGFAFFLVGELQGDRYKAYDVDAHAWVKDKYVSFCTPNETCTLYGRNN